MSTRLCRRFSLVLAFAATLTVAQIANGQGVPSPAPSARPNEPDKVVRAYPVANSTVADVMHRLTEKFPLTSGVRITHDPRSSQILVIAPPAVQEQIAKLIASDKPASGEPASPSATAGASEQAQTAVQRGPKVVPLHNLSSSDFETALNGIFGKQLPITKEHGGDWDRYILETRGGRVSMIVDRKAGQVALEGPVKLADAWAQIVESLDNHPQSGGDTRIVPLTTAKNVDVMKALTAVRDGGAVVPANTANLSQPGDGKSLPNPKADGSSTGRMINMIFQPRAEGDADNTASNALAQGPTPQLAQGPGGNPGDNQPTGNNPGAPQQSVTGAGELIGPVQIEFLEGLDMIVVRGNPRDVERVQEIIKQIEELSSQTQPQIEIYPLKFVNGSSLATIVQNLYDQTLATREGRVTITALGKPNSLLLIGRPEAVQSVIELTKKLDQPVNPQTLFQVFPLKNASAQAAQTVVNQFFNRAGLGFQSGLQSSASVTLDYRTNSLIVQASPRDLQEVESLLKKIDSPSSAAVNELRIFPLKNSVADELAVTLQQAISGQAPQGRGQPGQQQQQGFQGGAQPGQGAGGGFGAGGGAGGGFGAGGAGAAGGAQAQNQLAQQQRSTNVRFVTLDAEGKQVYRSGIVTDVHISADSRANTLLVSAPAESMELIAALVSQLDHLPSSTSEIKVFEIKNGDAVSMVTMLTTLFGQQQQRVTVNQGGGGPFGGGPQGGSIEVENTLVPVKFSVDQRTNSIIASGSSGDLEVVEAILLKLDESDVRLRKSMIYRLKNVFAPNVAAAITQFLTQERTIEQQFQPAGTINPFEEIDREVVVVAEQTSNSLIVSATPRFFDEIQHLIEQLDRRPPMVMIQVLIAEVTLNNTDEFGVELGLQDGVLFNRSLVGSPTFVTRSITTTLPNGTQTTTNEIVGADNVPGFNFNSSGAANGLGNSGSDRALNGSDLVGGQGLSNLGVGRINSTLGYGGLVLSASSESVSALLRALSECRRVDVLSRPQIMTLDNQQALLQVGQRVPRITASNITTAGTINTTTLDNVGILLQVQPRVSPDNLIVMAVDAEKSDIGPEDQGIPISINTNGQVIRSPFYNTQLAQTTVQATEGQSIVLGGLITSTKNQLHRRIPYLSNLPLLGNLFRFDSVAQERTELLIVLTPHIVRDEADADRIKQAEASRMSWCLGDVIKLNGPSGLRTRFDEFSNAETTVVYPDLNPDGTAKLPGPDMPKGSAEELPTPALKPPMRPPTPPQPTPAKPPS